MAKMGIFWALNRKSVTWLAMAGLAALGLSAMACGSGNPTSPSGNANLRLLLTDAPTDGVEQVNVYFTSVTVQPVNGSPQDIPLQLDTNPVDLLTLADKVVGFAAGAVEPGDFDYIRINIDPAKSNIVVDGVTKSLKVPSEEVKLLGGFTVDADHLTTMTLDFNAQKSLVSLGNGDWLLKPVIVKSHMETTPQS